MRAHLQLIGSLAVITIGACGTIDTGRQLNVRGVTAAQLTTLRNCNLRIFGVDGLLLGSESSSGSSFQRVMVVNRPWPSSDQTVRIELMCAGMEAVSQEVLVRNLSAEKEIQLLLRPKSVAQ